MIRNPMDPGNPVWDMAFTFYAMEQEGDIYTHDGSLNKLCSLIRENYDELSNDPDFIYELENEAYVDWNLTPKDLDYIYRKTGIYLTRY